MLTAHDSKTILFCPPNLIMNTEDLGVTMLSVNAHRVSSSNPICFFFLIFKCLWIFKCLSHFLYSGFCICFYLIVVATYISDFCISQLPYKIVFKEKALGLGLFIYVRHWFLCNLLFVLVLWTKETKKKWQWRKTTKWIMWMWSREILYWLELKLMRVAKRSWNGHLTQLQENMENVLLLLFMFVQLFVSSSSLY